MTATVAAKRILRPALVTTSAGWMVALTPAPWPGPVGVGPLRPASIASTAHVAAPAITAAELGSVTPPAIGSSASMLAPTLQAAGAPSPLQPSMIASSAAVPAPAIARAAAGEISVPMIAAGSAVAAPTLTAAPSIYNTNGNSDLRGDQVAGFADLANALDARLTALGY